MYKRYKDIHFNNNIGLLRILFSTVKSSVFHYYYNFSFVIFWSYYNIIFIINVLKEGCVCENIVPKMTRICDLIYHKM